MRTPPRRALPSAIAVLALALGACAPGQPDAPAPAPAASGPQQQEEGWISLFDGESLDGWEAYDFNKKLDDLSGRWYVDDGVIHGRGDISHLYAPRGDYKNFRYRAEIKINDGGNSGMYFRAARGAGFPQGYEAQVNSTHTDPVRTGSLYGMVLILRQLVPPDTWFVQEIEAAGNTIIVRVDGEEIYRVVDANNTYTEGSFAFQQHDPGSEVEIRRVEVLPLPD